MKLLINGACGRMGRAVLAMIDQGIQGAELAGAVDSYGSGDGILKSLNDFTGKADCIIDFSNHAATAELCAYIQKTKIPAVIATTGQTPEELAMIDEAAGGELRFDQYPRCREYLENLRARMIAKLGELFA